MGCWVTGGYAGYRYTLTEGDFHHLKNARLTHLHLPPLKIVTIHECDSSEASATTMPHPTAPPKTSLAIFQVSMEGLAAKGLGGGTPTLAWQVAPFPLSGQSFISEQGGRLAVVHRGWLGPARPLTHQCSLTCHCFLLHLALSHSPRGRPSLAAPWAPAPPCQVTPTTLPRALLTSRSALPHPVTPGKAPR